MAPSKGKSGSRVPVKKGSQKTLTKEVSNSRKVKNPTKSKKQQTKEKVSTSSKPHMKVKESAVTGKGRLDKKENQNSYQVSSNKEESRKCDLSTKKDKENDKRADDKDEKKKDSEGEEFYDMVVKSISHQQWYHGFMPREDCKKFMQEIGDFLLRRTTVDDKPFFILSVLVPGGSSKVLKCTHIRIDFKIGCWSINDGISHKSLMSLIKYYQSKPAKYSSVPGAFLKNAVRRPDYSLVLEDIIVGKGSTEGGEKADVGPLKDTKPLEYKEEKPPPESSKRAAPSIKPSPAIGQIVNGIAMRSGDSSLEFVRPKDVAAYFAAGAAASSEMRGGNASRDSAMRLVTSRAAAMTEYRAANKPLYLLIGSPVVNLPDIVNRVSSNLGLSRVVKSVVVSEEIKSGSGRGMEFARCRKTGTEFDAMSLTCAVRDSMLLSFHAGSKGFLLVEYPTCVVTASHFEQEVGQFNRVILVLPEYMVEEKFDNETKVKHDQYMKKIEPLVRHFRARNLISEIRGERDSAARRVVRVVEALKTTGRSASRGRETTALRRPLNTQR